MSRKLIALDNGHGLNTPGKRTPIFTDGTVSTYTKRNYMAEWEFNRGTVKRLREELERNGFEVLEVSPTEIDTGLMKRVKLANEKKADLFISVHANALGNAWNLDVKGVETLTSGTGAGHKLGGIVQKHLVAASGLRDRGVKVRRDLAVIIYTRMPSILVEAGFMDNPTEARMLLSSEYRQSVAEAICKGICEFYGVQYK